MCVPNPAAAPVRGDDGSACAIPAEAISAGRAFPLRSRAGGSCRDWIRYLHQELGDPLRDAGEPMRRMFRIYLRENRTDRLVNRLVALEAEAQAELARERAEKEALQREISLNRRMLDDRDMQFSALKSEFAALQRDWAWRSLREARRGLLRIRGLFGTARAARRTGQAAG